MRFCGDCGGALASSCASCGGENPPGKRFCGHCGSSLEAGAAAPPLTVVPAVGVERRHVTVLFADLVGFTAASESRDAEDTRLLLSQYFETCQRLISRYGGTVEKFIGVCDPETVKVPPYRRRRVPVMRVMRGDAGNWTCTG
jgi:hypothetical protein